MSKKHLVYSLIKMLNNDRQTLFRYLLFLSVLQVTVFAIILLSYPISIQEPVLVSLTKKDLTWEVVANNRAVGTKPVSAKLELEVATQNLPLKPEYLNGSLAFPNNFVPLPLHGWVPSNDSFRFFQPMKNHDAWVYSAYYDEGKAKIGRPAIVGIGFARNPVPRRIYCHYHLYRGKKFRSQAGHMRMLPEHHKTNVVPVFLECNIADNLRPKAVSFTFEKKTTMTNNLLLQYPKPRSHNITVCYSALHSKFKFSSQLVWSIEMNRIFGAEHFFVYNFSISSQVDSILRHYSKVGLVTVLQWPVPTLETWYIGQMALINDCLYRNRNFSKYVAFVDTDELIVPTVRYNWIELIEDVENNPYLEQWLNSKIPKVTNTNIKIKKSNSSSKPSKNETVRIRRLLSVPDSYTDDKRIQTKQDVKLVSLSKQKASATASKPIQENRSSNQNKSPSNPMYVSKNTNISTKTTNSKKTESLKAEQKIISDTIKTKQTVDNITDQKTIPSKPTVKFNNPAKAEVAQQTSPKEGSPLKNKAIGISNNKTVKATIPETSINKNTSKTSIGQRVVNKDVIHISTKNSISSQSSSSPPKPIGSFLFKSAFFCYKRTPYGDTIKSKFSISKAEDDFIRYFKVNPLRDYIHYDVQFKHRQRSKMIVKPELVRLIGIHYVYEHTGRARSANVALDAAMLHHYRSFDLQNSNTVTDHVFRYKSTLIKKLNERFAKFPKIFWRKKLLS